MQTRQYRLQIAASRPPSEVEPWAVTRMREFLPVIRATRKSNTAKNAWYALLYCFSSDFTFITGFGSHVSISSVPHAVLTGLVPGVLCQAVSDCQSRSVQHV